MADIPSYFAQQPLERERLPRAPVGIADVGAGIEAEAMAEFGGVLSDVIQKWYEREGNAQFDTQRRLVREEINKFELTGFNTSDEHDAAYKKLKATIKKLTPKNRMGARKFQSWRDYISPTIDRFAAEKKIRQIHQNNQVEYFKNISGITTEKDFDKAKAEAKLLTQGAIDDHTRTPAQAASDYQRIMADWGEAQKQAFLNTAHEAAKAMPYTDAISYLNDLKGITSAERNDLITRRKRRKEIETASHNDGVYWDTLRKLTKDRDSISDDELEALVKPDSLSVDDWKELAEMKKPDGLLSKPSVKTALTLFDNLKTAGAFVGKDPADMTLEEKRENIQLWADIKNDFIKWIQDNPNATEDQIEKKQKMLTEPERKEITLNWLQRLLLKKKGHQLFGLVKSEAELLAEKKRKAPKTLTEIDIKERAAREAKIRAAVVPLNLKYKTRLQPSLLDDTSDEFFGIWSKLDDNKKLKALQALENGYTEQEVLTALE